MTGEQQMAQEALFYELSPERHVPNDHWVRAIDRFVDLSDLCAQARVMVAPIADISAMPESCSFFCTASASPARPGCSRPWRNYTCDKSVAGFCGPTETAQYLGRPRPGDPFRQPEGMNQVEAIQRDGSVHAVAFTPNART
jgi:hypothetical protein